MVFNHYQFTFFEKKSWKIPSIRVVSSPIDLPKRELQHTLSHGKVYIFQILKIAQSDMSKRKILLVDDSKSARYALRLMLQKHDVEVDMAESAEVALEKVKEELPDAIFLDHLMPGMNGFEALDALKKDANTAQVPVVMCTSNDDEPYQIQAREKGALGILPKPATPDKLNAMLGAIESAIGQAGGAPAAPAPAPAIDEAAIAALVSAQVERLGKEKVEPLLNQSLDARLEELKAGVFESVMERSAVQMAQWMEAEMTQVREMIPEPVKTEDLSAKLDAETQQLRADLVKMETDHAQAVVHKINNETLPDLVATQMDVMERHLDQRLEQRMEELSERLVRELPTNDRLIRQLSEIAETVAEHKAQEIAAARAQEIAESALEEQSEEVSEQMASSQQASTKLMYMLAGGAAGIGVLSSIIFSLIF